MLPSGPSSLFDDDYAYGAALACDKCKRPILELPASVVYGFSEGETRLPFEIFHQACDPGSAPRSISLEEFAANWPNDI